VLRSPSIRIESSRRPEVNRPAPALVVDVAKALLDEPVDIGQAADETELDLTHHLDRSNADEHAGGRSQAERPRLLVQDDTQQRAVHFEPAVVFNQPEFAELVHEEVHA
jgi:hypothetical protein